MRPIYPNIPIPSQGAILRFNTGARSLWTEQMVDEVRPPDLEAGGKIPRGGAGSGLAVLSIPSEPSQGHIPRTAAGFLVLSACCRR